jgi:hypothetical protein
MPGFNEQASVTREAALVLNSSDDFSRQRDSSRHYGFIHCIAARMICKAL